MVNYLYKNNFGWIYYEQKRKNEKTDEKGRKMGACHFYMGLFGVFSRCAVGIYRGNRFGKGRESVWADWQNEYVALLEQRYAADENFSKVNDEDFLTRTDMAEVLGAKLNEIRYIASHNSYKTGLTPETKYFYHGPLAAIMGKQYDYIFDTITEQLNAGIRSIELDANKVKTADGFRIECLHSDMLETNSTMIDFDKGLKEIRMWMDRNENALPIIVLVEPKGGKKFDLEAFDKFDEMLFENFGEKLVTPKKLLDAAGVSDFDEFRAKNAYPTVESLKGKIIFLLHEKDSLETYMQRDPDMQKSAMNIALEYNTVLKKGKDYSRFSFTVILNDPTKHKDRISEAINRDNFMVRTRLDRYAVVKDHWYKNGIESGANILSTDYTPHAKERIMEYPTKGKWTDTYYAILYEADKTVTLRGK